MRTTITTLLLLCLVGTQQISAQDTGEKPVDNQFLNLYVDCNYCDMEYIKQEITCINYVRDRREANVHLMMTSQLNGGNGRKMTLFFLGHDKFVGQNDTLFYHLSADASEDEKRKKMKKMIVLGLMRYVAHTPAIENFNISYTSPDTSNNTTEVDKWKAWVFSGNANAFFSGEQQRSNLSVYGSAEISKVTPEWKIEMYMNRNISKSSVQIGDEVITSSNASKGASTNYVKSLTPHSSFGFFGRYQSSEFSNIKKSFNGHIGYEYNLYTYDQSSRKQLRFNYLFGGVSNDYRDTTMYNLLSERLPEQKISLSFSRQETWGSISSNILWRNFLHDFEMNSLRINVYFNFKLIKGLSLNAGGNFSFIRNQISLRKNGASDSDILLQQQELATSYRYYGNFGLRYTFGSIYNNVVNPRF